MPSLQTRLASSIGEDEMIQKLAELVALESVVEDGHTEYKVAQAVSAWCVEDSLTFELSEVSPGRPNLLIEWRGKRPGPALLFEAHSDTVTAGDLSQWSRLPFRLTREGDRVYGRGTADTKGNLVAAYIGIRELVRTTQGNFPGCLRLLVPIDEEGMMTGIRHYIASGGTADVKAAICCEPEDAQVCIRQKGALRLRVEIHGKMAHGAMPLTGSNPLPVLARFLVAIAEEEIREQERMGFDTLLGWPSMTPTEIRSPLAGVSGFNVVPGAAAVSLDIRTVVGQSHRDLTQRIQQNLDEVLEEANRSIREGRVCRLRHPLGESIDPGEFHGTVVVVDDRPVTDTPVDHAVVQSVVAAVHERLGVPAVLSGVPGATDGTWLWEAGIPIVTVGAGHRYVPHQADEWVSLRQLCDIAVIYGDAAYRFLTAMEGVEVEEVNDG